MGLIFVFVKVYNYIKIGSVILEERRINMIRIVEVKDADEINAVEELAKKIWNEHYIPIIGKEQVDYMLSKFQSKEAIRKQIDGGYRYFLSLYGEKRAGYFAILPDEPKGSMFLSKLYVDKEFRGQGIGRASVSYIEDICKNSGLNTIWLTVNKNNENSIKVYKKLGFVIVESIVQDIGNGFVMDDYKMEKRI